MGIGTFVKQPARSTAPAAARHASPRGDIILLAVTAVLVIYGLLMVNSASPDYCVNVLHKTAMCMFNKQLIWLTLGILVAFGLTRLDYHFWQRVAVPMMAVVILLLFGVLINNQVSNETVRSFINGSIQPSELAKLAIVIYLSVWLYAKRDSLHDIQLGLIPLAAILGIVGGLIFIQPDLSAGATIFILGGLLFFLAGGDLRQFVLFIVVALAVGWVTLQLDNKGSDRLSSYVAGLKNPLESNYQILRSIEAFVRGGWFGLGLGNSITKVTGLPVPPTDSIFAVLAEELGILGTVALISLYGFLLWRGIRIAQRAPDTLGAMMAGGLTFWIIIEAVFNMSFIVGLLPVTGNALPFISYGGSSLVCTLAAIGILYGISRQSGAPARETGEWRIFGATADLRRRDRRRRVPRTSRP